MCVLVIEQFLETANDPKRKYLAAVYKDLAERVKRINPRSTVTTLKKIRELKQYNLVAYKQLDAEVDR